MTWPCSFKIAAISSTVIVTDPSTTRLVGAVDKGCRRAAQEDCCRCKFVGAAHAASWIKSEHLLIFGRVFALQLAEETIIDIHHAGRDIIGAHTLWAPILDRLLVKVRRLALIDA